MILIVLLAVYLVASLLSFNPTLYTGGDNAHYIILARSMLSGKGYRDIYKPEEPLHTLYPFGYPLLLAPVMALFGGSFIAIKLLSLVLGAGSVMVIFLLLREGSPRILLCSVVGLFALSAILLAGLGVDFVTSFAAIAATIGNIGPGFGMVGPVENYAQIPILGKWLLIWCMLLGRLEIYTVIILVVPEFWRK